MSASFQWTRSAANSIIQDFDPDTNGNQTVNNNFTFLSGLNPLGLSADGVIYGFRLGMISSLMLSIEGITLDFTNIPVPSGRYGLSLQVFAISGAIVGKFVTLNKSLDAVSITLPPGIFNSDVRILVTVFDEVTGVPINAVSNYKVVLLRT